MRVGLVGAGWAAEQHVASLAALGEAPPSAVTDVDPARAGRLARACGARVVGGIEEMPRLDAAIVTTPAGVHAAALLPLLAAGVAVFVEKPLAVRIADARAITAAAAGLPVAVGYQWRAVPALAALERELAGQRVALLASTGIGITQARPWFTDPELSGGLLGERGSHHLDLLRHLGGPITGVRAVAGGVRVSGAAPVGPTDVVTLTCTHANGAVSTTALVWASADHPPEQSLRVIADGGHYLLALDPHFRLTGRTGLRDVGVPGSRVPGSTVPFVAQLARFLAAVRTGDPADVCCTADEAAETVAVVEAAGLALETGERVGIGPEDIGPVGIGPEGIGMVKKTWRA